MKKTILAVATAFLLSCTGMAEEEAGTVLTFDANATTGYSWTGFVLGGDCVELDSAEGSYVEDDNPEMLDGVSGKTYYKLKALKPGRGIIRFSYGQGWNPDTSEQTLILVDVDEDMKITTMDITESSMLEGVVMEVNPETHAANLESDRLGEVIVYFDEDEELPVEQEEICLYTDGTMTMSLPPIVNAISWGSVPSEDAREENTEISTVPEENFCKKRSECCKCNQN